MQLGSVGAAIGLGGDHRDHPTLKPRQSGWVCHELSEQLSKGDADIGADREKSSHVGHELGIGLSLGDTTLRHLGVSDLTLLV